MPAFPVSLDEAKHRLEQAMGGMPVLRERGAEAMPRFFQWYENDQLRRTLAAASPDPLPGVARPRL